MPRSRILTHERFARTPAPDPAQRGLTAIREIVHAFLNADRPEEVFQFALDRVSPLIGASFASVYLVDGVSELMRLAAAYNWPAKYRPWLGEMRVRIGFGPSGEAVSERRVIEVPDVSSDRGLEDWAEVATELGFRSLVALPLEDATGALGTVTFYFAESGTPPPDRRTLMRLVADQMAATAEKVKFVEELRRGRAALSDANAELERQYAAVTEARRARDELLANATEQLRSPVTTIIAALETLSLHPDVGAVGPLADARRAADQALWRIDELLEYAALQAGTVPVDLEEFDPREVMAGALRLVESQSDPVHLHLVPAQEEIRIRSDRRKAMRILASLLLAAVQWTREGEVTLACEVDSDRVRFRVLGAGPGAPREARDALVEGYRSVAGMGGGVGLGVALSDRLARACGGAVQVDSSPGEGVTFTLELPIDRMAADP